MNTTKTWQEHAHRLSAARRAKMLAVASAKTDRLRLVLQDVDDPHNVSACIRSAEAFGLVNIHIINAKGRFKVTSPARGAKRWVYVHKHSSVEECAQLLKASGFVLAAAIPRSDAVALEDLPCQHPVALLFGNEHLGLASAWEPWLDSYYTVPMVGMVESLNVSVSAAISMYTMRWRIFSKLGEQAFLGDQGRESLLDDWLSKDLSKAQASAS